jgi:ribonuclease P/MRP protein subunit RPP1
MKRFADLHLRVPFNNMPMAEQMITKAAELGYSMVGITLPQKVAAEQVGLLKQFCSNVKLDFVSRIDLAPRNSNELTQNLRTCRRKFEVIAVRCTTKEVARQAAKDRRVDLLMFSVTNVRQRFFDKSEAELAQQALCGLEIELSPLLQLTSVSRVRVLSRLRKEAETAKRANVPVTLSSGATDPYLMRGPYDFAAMATIFGLRSDSALCALSASAYGLVERNREKLSAGFGAPGIRVKVRKDC